MLRKLALGSLVAALMAGTASADTLREALVSTYRPTRRSPASARRCEATDANVAIARAAGRPQVSATVGVNRDLTRSGILDTAARARRSRSASTSATPCSTAAASGTTSGPPRPGSRPGRATLRAVEGDVFTEAVAAYMDVIRDRAIVELNQNKVQVLTTNLEATRDRFEIGDLTRTDVAQSEARLQLGRSLLATAQGRLTAARRITAG